MVEQSMQDARVAAVLKHAAQKCESAGVKLTGKRAQLLGILVAANSALSAYEVLDRYNASQPKPMPPMSAYRILDFLVANELIHKVASDQKYVACAHIKCSHVHQGAQFLICQVCGRIQEILLQQNTIDLIKNQLGALGYQLMSSHIELDCLCAGCSK
jgi:Fur family transcriptional regulator, zinc uptake regulator